MKTPDQWFDQYGVCHQHPTNKFIHWFAVPLIFVSIIGLLWEIPLPSFLPKHALLNCATIILVGVLFFYFRLSISLGIGMTLFSTLAVMLVAYYDQLNFSATWLASLILFVALWILQFIGHNIEGRKPAFFDDIKFLLIGPLWLMGFIYRKLHIKY